MRRWASSTACEEAGQLISLRLDGELSEFEATALDRHLEVCAGCRTFAEELGGIAHMLREAPLVELDRELVPAAPRPVRGHLVGRAVGAVALAGAAAVAALAVFGPSGRQPVYGGAPAFRSAQEQIRYVRAEQQRIEPAQPAEYVPVAPQVTARSL